MVNKQIPKTEEEWKEVLTEKEYKVLRQKGTEAPFSGKLLHSDKDGVYTCAACGNPLFNSDAKFDSGTGWPSFDTALSGAIKEVPDNSHGMSRVETVCARCGSHLGHVFGDLPAPRPNTYYIYVIFCEDNSMYIGQTQDLRKRWKEHIAGTATEHTRKFKPQRIIHYEECSLRDEAVKREKELKTGFGRKWLKREYKAGRTRQAGGPTKTGKRYCMNSVCLEMEEKI